MLHDLLTEDAHYNFPKMHLVSHFADQITKYGSLPQFSTDICEASHKPLKEAYRQSNKINVMTQIVDTYTRGHAFAMREKNIAQWDRELEHIPEDVSKVLRPTPGSIHVPHGYPCPHIKLQGPINSKHVHNLQTLATHYKIPELQSLTQVYLVKSTLEADPLHCMNAPIQVFHTLQMPVKTFYNNGYIIYRLQCTDPHLFRQNEQRHD